MTGAQLHNYVKDFFLINIPTAYSVQPIVCSILRKLCVIRNIVDKLTTAILLD